MKKITGWMTEDGLFWEENQEQQAISHEKHLIVRKELDSFRDIIDYNDDAGFRCVSYDEFPDFAISNAERLVAILSKII